MNFSNQSSALAELKYLAGGNQHSILIEGASGTGKTFLAKRYADLIGIADFHIVDAKVDVLKSIMEQCTVNTTPVVLCVENLDLGVNAASYAILKFLEEPYDYVYIVITCRNSKQLPDTIISRCSTVILPQVSNSDIKLYAEHQNSEKFNIVKTKSICSAVRSFSDVDIILSLSEEQINYIYTLADVIKGNESVSGIVWKLQKFPDGAATPIEFIIQSLMIITSNTQHWVLYHNCLKSLSQHLIGSHAVLSKLVFEIKYQK